MAISPPLPVNSCSLKAWPWGNKILPCLLLFAAFLVIGYFTGWVVGASRSPIANTVVPLGVGLLSAISFALFERRNLFESFLKSIKDLEDAKEVQPGTLTKVRAVIGGPAEVSFWPPTIWGIGAVAFCLACLLGISAGVAFRVPKYRPLQELLGNVKPTTREMGELTRFEWHSKATNVPREDYESVFRTAILLLLTEDIPDNELLWSRRRPLGPLEKVTKPTAEEKLADLRETRYQRLRSLVNDLVTTKRDVSTMPQPKTTPSPD